MVRQFFCPSFIVAADGDGQWKTVVAAAANNGRQWWTMAVSGNRQWLVAGDGDRGGSWRQTMVDGGNERW